MQTAIDTTKKQIYGQMVKVSMLSPSEKKVILINALKEKGFGHSDIAEITNISRAHTYNLDKKQSTGLLAPLAKLARRRVKDVLSGKAIDNTEKAKTSDVLKCAEMVLDRAEPKINRQEIKSLHANIDITVEERAALAQSLGIAQIIDITPHEAEIPKIPVCTTENHE